MNNFIIKISLSIICLVLIFFERIAFADIVNNKKNENVIEVLSKQNLWSQRDAYDTGHYLMIPLHYSFINNEQKNIKNYKILFNNFNKNKKDLLTKNLLDQVHWNYLLSNYLVLSGNEVYKETYNLELLEFLLLFLENQWLKNPRVNWQYAINKYNNSETPKGSKEYLDFINNNQSRFVRKYYGAVTDVELFLFAIAADISNILNNVNDPIIKKYKASYERTIKEILSYGITFILNQGSFENDNKWIFQKGMWSDHQDYAYAGHDKLENNLSKLKVNDIAPDSSHAHRLPLFFRSLLQSDINNLEKKKLNQAFQGFCRNFINNISFKNNMVLLTNFTDGTNGLYRYKYQTVGKNTQLGYGPYQLSTILFFGWYSFCPNTSYIWLFMDKMLPLNTETIKFYTGPNTTRSRNPYFELPNFFNSELSKLIISQSIFISNIKN